MKINERIKDYRLSKGITQKYIAEKAGISNKKLSFIENGNVELKAKDLISISKALEVPVSFFTNEVLENKNSKIIS